MLTDYVNGASWGAGVPGSEFVDTVDGLVGEGREHVAQVGFGIDAVEFGGADQAVDRGGTFAASVRAREQVVLATQGPGAQRSLQQGIEAGHAREEAGSPCGGLARFHSIKEEGCVTSD
jgi:hypothetical protein